MAAVYRNRDRIAGGLRSLVIYETSVIANAPVVASFWIYPEMPVELWYVLIGYLVAWALFLVSRWRKTDVAVAVLNNEIRYYLIDQEQEHESRNHWRYWFRGQSSG